MKTRRRTVDSRSLLSENESMDAYATAPSIESLITITSAQTSASITTPAEVSTVTTATSTGMSVSPSNQPTTATLKSDVWQHFERVTDSHPLKAKCKTCSEQLLTPNYGMSSLKRHLVQRHNLQQFASNKVSSRHTTPIHLSRVEKKRLDDLAVKAIIKDSRAFGDFHKSGLESFIDALKPGYKAPNRNVVVKQLKRLTQHHRTQTKVEFEEADFISVTCDFWKNRQQQSFLVITGHYVDANFNEHAKILNFLTFDERHFSVLIAQEIEKQLINLGLYDKLVTITCDGANNMRDMFTYFNRRNIKYLHCVAHKLHLVICNSLNLWVPIKKKQKTVTINETLEINTDQDDTDDDTHNGLNRMIRTMSFDVNESLNQSNADEDIQEDSSTEDDAMDESPTNDQTNESTSDEEDWVDDEDDDDDEIVDNFVEGVNTEDTSLDDLQKKIRDIIEITRDIVVTTKRTSILSMFMEKKRSTVNVHLKKQKKKTIKRRLCIEVRTRWNSTFKMLSTIVLYRDIINDMFKSKGNLGLTTKQRQKLGKIELSTDQWDLLNTLVTLLEPFYSATKLLSNKKYPTIGTALYLIKQLEEYLEKEEDNPVLNSLKSKVLIKFRHYMYSDMDQFNTLKLYGYLDPMGFSALTRAEQSSVEKELIMAYKKEVDSAPTSSSATTTSSARRPTITKSNNIDKAWQGFLKSINKELPSEVPSTTIIQDEIRNYRNLATKFFIDHQYTHATAFWKKHGGDLPLLSRMAKCYLSAPATSVASESAFSVSAHYGRKERSRLSPDNLAMSVFLKHKL